MKTAETTIAHPTAYPKIATREEWLAKRRKHLAHEKELTKHRDRVSAERRRLPMVKIEKDYFFEGPEGKKTLLELFEGQQQLIVYHFMFDPRWDEGCPGCTGYVDSLGDLSMLKERNSTFVLISRAPLPKLQTYRKRKGWDRPWFSSFGSHFNYDFHATLDEKVAPPEYNYRSLEEMKKRRGEDFHSEGEQHGLSVFFRIDDEIFHAYSSFARGVENLTDSYSLLDTTPLGRQEDWEDSPPGWPQKPTYG